MNNTKRIARRLQRHFNIPYTQALQCLRDTRELPAFHNKLQQLRTAGLKPDDATFQFCVENWDFDG